MTTDSHPPAARFLLPDLGEGLTEAELVSWQVQVGDTVRLNQTLCEVETAKASVELPSPFAGTVRALLVAEGATAQVGDALIEISSGQAAPAPVPAPGILVGSGPLAHRPSRIRRADYQAARPATERATARPTTARPLARETRIPVRGVRRAMAESVSLSARTIPQVTEFLTVDVSASMRLLRELKHDTDFRDLKLTPLTLAALSLLVALREHPELNSSWDADAVEVVEKHYVNLGIAVASPRGLIVPNIKDADALGLAGLARAIAELTAAARAATTAPADLVGGTISITNVGVFGIDTGTPILNPGEAAILCLGSVAQRPWVRRGKLAVRDITTLGLTFDHRLADGAQASSFLARLGAGLENPLRLIV